MCALVGYFNSFLELIIELPIVWGNTAFTIWKVEFKTLIQSEVSLK